jgi:hypothetical protein
MYNTYMIIKTGINAYKTVQSHMKTDKTDSYDINEWNIFEAQKYK